MNRFNSTDMGLFESAKRYMRDSKGISRGAAYTRNAELLWVGEHYLLIRSGLYEGTRDAEIWSREALLLRKGNRAGNPMVELALATINPVNDRWAKNFRRIVWQSGSKGKGATPQLSNRRWSKSCLRDAIAYCEAEDALFEHKEAEEIEYRAAADEFCRQSVTAFGDAGTKTRVLGSPRRDPGQWPAGCTYRVALCEEITRRDNFSFKVKLNGKVTVSWRDGLMNFEEFEILRDALLEIHNSRKGREGDLDETADN